MALDLAALDAKELVLVVVALLGLIPVVTQRTERSGLFTLGYVLLFFGAVATNVEHVVLGGVFGFLEHAVGIGAAGAVFLLAAYRRRQRILAGDERAVAAADADGTDEADEPAAVADGGEAV
ncbi:hypothetical protein [Candidatus Halobonum tyrrellensis]|uniref:Uncharacterized protein n=1 Tax=Candidatus Halobonum tyrrellensis G22 TaxID=1324957 RepID=V4GSK6_9EURY|nr:hypothetical protein [Candidatus Halobonum tyrrellensis]ESP88076.1 hypothetical protein K933_11019 [Candidatus Halobonum tyrrellensis G22]